MGRQFVYDAVNFPNEEGERAAMQYLIAQGCRNIAIVGHMLFGIYGNRWIKDQPEFKKYINEYWTRPSIDERPKNVEKVEGGCYW